MRLYINNILVSTAWLYWDCAYNRDEQNYNIVPVSKGDVITFSGGNNGVYFTPFDILPMPKCRGFLDTNDTCLLK